MMRITKNTYEAVCFLVSDVSPDSARKPTFVLVVPPVNRQLMDLLFTLIYIRDDFGPRSLAYERASWRAFKEEYEKQKSRFASTESKEYFAHFKRMLGSLQKAVKLTAADIRHPDRISRCKGPSKLAKQKTTSQAFLQWMEKWLYDDTSAEAHVTGTGIFKLSPFLMSNIANPDTRELIENHQIHQYKTHHVARTFLIALAIATEIDDHCRLNTTQTSRTSGRSSEATSVKQAKCSTSDTEQCSLLTPHEWPL